MDKISQKTGETVVIKPVFLAFTGSNNEFDSANLEYRSAYENIG